MRVQRRLLGLLAAGLAAGLLGWGSGAVADGGSASDEPPQQAERVGDDVCLECHAQYADAWRSVRHNRFFHDERLPESVRGCEGCHGPGSLHLEDENFLSIKNADRMTGLDAVEACLACHRGNIKPQEWMAGAHSENGMNCGTCHEVHTTPGGPSLLRLPSTELCLSCHKGLEAELRLNSHHPVIEGRMDCTDCHNPHRAGTNSGDLLKTGDDRCVRCHLDKRGPFAFEHQTDPADGDEGCLTCHRPHGSPNADLGRYFGRAMCLQCHSDIAGDARHRPRTQSCWATGCHIAIHGSNVTRTLLR